MLDFFRFGDFRTSFSNSQLSSPAALIPFGPPGPGLSLKWWPSAESELYVVATFTDINAPAGEWDWGRLTEYDRSEMRGYFEKHGLLNRFEELDEQG